MAVNPRARRARISGSKPVASAHAPWTRTIVGVSRSEEHTSELQSHVNLVCRLLLEKKKRLILEINQAGLSWSLMLKKEENFKSAFDDFQVNKIAQYDEQKIEELMNNAGIVRNKRKIEAVIYNAQKVIEIQKKYGSFNLCLDEHIGYSLKDFIYNDTTTTEIYTLSLHDALPI